MELFDRIVNPNLLVRRINLTTNHVVDEDTAAKNPSPVQYDLFTDYEALERKQREEKERLAKERQIQTAILNIKKQFGHTTTSSTCRTMFPKDIRRCPCITVLPSLLPLPH